METTPRPPIELPAQAYRHLVHTLIPLLPPPVEATPEALLARNHAAIARIAALAPVNADEAELAAQCIAARAQAEDVLRLLRLHADDINLTLRLNAQYSLMVRTSLSVHNRLLRAQQQRHKREAKETAADFDQQTRDTAADVMLHALPAEPIVLEAPPVPALSKPGTNSHTKKNETAKRRSWPEFPTPASISAVLDAALRDAGLPVPEFGRSASAMARLYPNPQPIALQRSA